MVKKNKKGGNFKGRKRQRGGVYKGKKRQRGEGVNSLAKNTKKKIIKSFNQAKTFIKQLANEGGNKLNQIGGTTINPRYSGLYRGMNNYASRLGPRIDKFYL